MVLTRQQEVEILVHILTVALGQPDDGSGMIKRVLRKHSLFTLETIADLTETDIKDDFLQLDANGNETSSQLLLGDRKRLHRLAGFIRITIYDNNDSIPDYADWMQVTRNDLAAFTINPRVPPSFY